jgi:hypothetical protein
MPVHILTPSEEVPLQTGFDWTRSNQTHQESLKGSENFAINGSYSRRRPDNDEFFIIYLLNKRQQP